MNPLCARVSSEVAKAASDRDGKAELALSDDPSTVRALQALLCGSRNPLGPVGTSSRRCNAYARAVFGNDLAIVSRGPRHVDPEDGAGRLKAHLPRQQGPRAKLACDRGWMCD